MFTVNHMIMYGTNALDMLRVFGSWDDYMNGIPLHATPENSGFVTWIALHSGLYHYYFEGARQENNRAFFFTFIDDQEPYTSVWKEELGSFKDENFIRIKTRNVILQPYRILDVEIVNNGDPDMQYFQYKLTGFTRFQEYKFEVWAESAVGQGPSKVTNDSVHFTTPRIRSYVEIYFLILFPS